MCKLKSLIMETKLSLSVTVTWNYEPLEAVYTSRIAATLPLWVREGQTAALQHSLLQHQPCHHLCIYTIIPNSFATNAWLVIQLRNCEIEWYILCFCTKQACIVMVFSGQLLTASKISSWTAIICNGIFLYKTSMRSDGLFWTVGDCF